jgi:hypothetical protein
MLNTVSQYHFFLPHNGMGIKMGVNIDEITTFIDFRLKYYNRSAFHCSKRRISVTIAHSLDLSNFIRHLYCTLNMLLPCSQISKC